MGISPTRIAQQCAKVPGRSVYLVDLWKADRPQLSPRYVGRANIAPLGRNLFGRPRRQSYESQ